jgi:exodeoxyribonuclease VII small subunit
MAKSKTSRTSSEPEELTFEEAMARLEKIVTQLEEGQLGLSESLARYEEAVQHLKQCHEALERAERRIQLLTGVDEDGNPLTEPFDDEALTLEEKQQSRPRRRSSGGKEGEKKTRRVAGKESGDPTGKGDVDMDTQRGLF